jgi:CheY-like chemotaxis protein
VKNSGFILVVDDHASERSALARLLTLSGYAVRTAGSLGEALAVADAVAAAGGLDLVVSDLGLPDGSGCELMQAMRSRYRVPGIAVSGFATPADARRSHAAGFDRHLNKPLCYDDLLEAIVKVLTGPVPAAAG